MARRTRGRPAVGRDYFHVVFTVLAEVVDIALRNTAVIYGSGWSSETMVTMPTPVISARASASPPFSTGSRLQ